MVCRICKSDSLKETFIAREMLEGSRDAFEYFICAECGTVQISSLLSDMSKYYNETYYSLGNKIAKNKNYLVKQRDKTALLNRLTGIGNLLNYFYPLYHEHQIVGKLLKPDSRLLDIGCGNGDFIRLLYSYGLRNLTGIEPYINKSTVIGNGCEIIKAELDSLEGKFDIVRIHHVLEHVVNPKGALEKIYNLLEPDGRVVLTIPISDYIFSKYKQNAYLVQAPHHFHLFTIEGIRNLAEENGFYVEQMSRNAKGIANWIRISELWKKDITEKEAAEMGTRIFSRKELLKFKKVEKQLVWELKGDNLTLVLRKDRE